jgi:large repetitive protein
MTKARDLSKLLSTANGKIEAGNVDIPPVSFENVVDTGTAGTKLASGTTQQRSSTTGIFRYNTTLGKFEGKNATDFVAIDPLPTITSVSNNNLSQDAINSGTNLVITGTNFDIGATVDFIGSDANVLNSASVTRNSSTQLTASVPNTVVNANEPYSVRVTNPSGSIVTLASAFSVNATPAFSTASGSLGTITDAQRSSYSISSAVATDAEGTAVTHSVISGSLPSGMTLNSNGTITGTPDLVTSATTSTFTVSATDGVNTSTRQFSITIGAFAITYATASGSLGSIVDTSRSSYSLSPVTATSTSGTLSYSVLSGSLPTNMSLNSSTGAITGTPSAVASDTTSTFTIRATASGSNQDRQFQ